jgi:hypothetical protein
MFRSLFRTFTGSRRQFGFTLAAVLLASITFLTGCVSTGARSAQSFSFIVASDMREFTAPRHPGPRFFEGACEAIQQVGKGDFMLSPGDIDPPGAIRATLDKYFGADYIWYPVVGNHEAETPEDMEWLRAWGSNAIPGLVRRGPPGCETTTFSFTHRGAHFVVLNQYYDGKKDNGNSRGNVVDELYEWLKADLEANRKRTVFVVGHEPIRPMPDMDNGRLRHEKTSLNANPENNRRFHELLRAHNVKAYFCAHTHNTSLTNLDGVWQIDSGHARGRGDPGASSTFLKVHVTGETCRVDIHRDDGQGGPYSLTRTVMLD